MIAWNCHGSLGGCHPHGHGGVHVALHSGFGGLGVLLFIVIIAAIWDIKTNR